VICPVSRLRAEPEADIGHRAGNQRKPVVHDPVAEDGEDRRRPRRAEAGGDGYQRYLYDAQSARRDGDGTRDVRRGVGDRQWPETRLITEGGSPCVRAGGRGQPEMYSLSTTSMTPLAIQAAATTASCSAQVRTWPVSVTLFPLVSTITSLSSRTSA
jgi:hypothetical protein